MKSELTVLGVRLQNDFPRVIVIVGVKKGKLRSTDRKPNTSADEHLNFKVGATIVFLRVYYCTDMYKNM